MKMIMLRVVSCLLPRAFLALNNPAPAQIAPPVEDAGTETSVRVDQLERETRHGAVSGLLRALAQRAFECPGRISIRPNRRWPPNVLRAYRLRRPSPNATVSLKRELLLAIHERLGKAGHALALPTTTVRRADVRAER
jgi:hypothetical protein